MDPDTLDLVRMNTREFGLTDSDSNTLYGYLAVFNEETEINSAREGHFIERIMPGAFKRTLDHRRDRIKILYDHGLDPSIGNKPLGKPSVLREDDTGLYVEVPLDDTSYNQDLKASLRSGALDGMSFRFSVPAGGDRWDFDGDIDRRDVTEAILYEGGPVTFPAYAGAAAGLRSWESLTELAPILPTPTSTLISRPDDPSLSLRTRPKGTPQSKRKRRAAQLRVLLNQ